MSTLDNKEIRGINFRMARIIIIGIVTLLTTTLTTYFNLKSHITSRDTDLLKKIVEITSQTRLIDTVTNIRLNAIDLNIQHLDIEIDLIKERLGRSNSVPKE